MKVFKIRIFMIIIFILSSFKEVYLYVENLLLIFLFFGGVLLELYGS